jgi:hypothetical protein
MESVKIFSIEDVEIDVSTIIDEIKAHRQLGQRKVEEKILKSYIKNGIVKFQNEQGDWEELENDNKDKIEEIVKILKNISSEKTEKPKKTKKNEKESSETEEIKPKTKKQTKKQTKKIEETETDNSVDEKVEKPKKAKKQTEKQVDIEGIEEKVKLYVENKIKEKLNELVDQVVKDVMIEIKNKKSSNPAEVTVNHVNKLGDQLKSLTLEKYEKTEEISECIEKESFDDLNELECSIDITE